jgi:aminopeptidase N
LNREFWHQTVTGTQIIEYMNREAGIDLSRVFEQYLTTTRIPVFENRIEGTTLSYRWSDVVPGFDMPLGVTLTGPGFTVIHPTEAWQTAALALPDGVEFAVDVNYYVVAREVRGR